jgi:hypothetical protein
MLGDFTYEVYEDLLETLSACGYRSLTVRDYLSDEHETDRFVVLRHDVDRKPANALDMARLEAQAGQSATYYVRAIDKTFDPEILATIEDLGHEVGYHYEDLDAADGDLAASHDSFADNLARFRDHVTVDTVCMHGNPLTPHDNRDMWESRSPAEYGLVGEGYLSVDFTDVTYFTDTNRTWYDEKTVVNDRPVGANGKTVQVRSTDDLQSLLSTRDVDTVYILTHPNRWADSYPELVLEWTKDAVVNTGKWGLWWVRRAGSRAAGAGEKHV